MSEHKSGRGSGIRAEFSRSTRSAVYASKGPQVSMATANKIVRSVDDAKARVTRRYAAQDEQRTNKAYGGLLRKHGLAPEPMPGWAANDAQAKLMARARAQVASDLSRQIGRLERAQANMLKTGQVRATRKVAWGKGLGE